MNIHFCGVGGIGMSALARYFLCTKHIVSGSDGVRSDLVQQLEKEGIIFIPEDHLFSEKIDLFIYSEAISEHHPQRVHAHNTGIKSLSYFGALGEISRQYKTIAICGTHGKTTTTAMLGTSLVHAGENPFVIVGTLVKEFGRKNIRIPRDFYFFPSQEASLVQQEGIYEQRVPLTPFRLREKFSKILGKTPYFIVEACEYRASFHKLSPFGVVFISCEYDHADFYKSFEEYKEAFKVFVASIPSDGFLVYNAEDEAINQIVKSAVCTLYPVYFSQIQNPITPNVPGVQNQLDAELAFKTAQVLLHDSYKKSDMISVKENMVKEGLSLYSGSARLFEILGEMNAITCIDDYGHHPTEVLLTLHALKQFAQNRTVHIVFQPHQYSRTFELLEGFLECFSILQKQDFLYLVDIYPARDTEEDKKKISSETLAELLQKKGISAQYSGDYASTLALLKKQTNSGDIILTIGAGPVNTIAEQFLQDS